MFDVKFSGSVSGSYLSVKDVMQANHKPKATCTLSNIKAHFIICESANSMWIIPGLNHRDFQKVAYYLPL
jgi:hypothetical protein